MHVADAERVQLDSFILINVARNWFEQSRKGRDEDAPHSSWDYFEEAFLGHLFTLGIERG